jgi:predicted amidohydrolase YtcJ
LQAERVFLNGQIYTMDATVPSAQAMAVRCGRILAVGDNARIEALAGLDTEKVDLHGRTTLPGFIDAHLHLVWLGLSLKQVRLDGALTLQRAVELVADRARMARPGEWIRGRGWNRNLWPGAPLPQKWDLDPVVPSNPVFLPSKDGHSAWVNSLALRLAGITAKTPDPLGGQLERDPETGEPTGVLKEGPAMMLVARAAGEPGLAEKAQGIRAAVAHLHRQGVVGVHSPEEETDLTALQTVWQQGDLNLRVSVLITDRWLEHVRAMGLRAGLGDPDGLRVFAIKVFADGALGSRTADMLEPYDEEPNNHGIQVTDSARLEQLVASCIAGGWNMAIHAIGDRANRRVLDALELHRQAWVAQGLRMRIEHAQLLAPEDLSRLGNMGVIASMQPIHCTSDMAMADKHWRERCRGAYAWRSLLDGGAVLAFGSDAPVEEPDVLRGIHAAVTRQREEGTPAGGWHPEQVLTLPEAVHAYTLGAAYACGQEKTRGSLSVGKLADMVVLSQDIMQLPPRELLRTHVELTILGGKVVYSL